MQAVILAGGLGTRLSPFTNDNPKPMYRFNDKPFIAYLVEQVKSFGITNILLLIGYKHEKIEEYLGDGSQFGVNISYDVTPVEFDTGARLKNAIPKINDDFLLMYCDNYCPIDFKKHLNNFHKNNADIQIVTYKNDDGYTKGNVIIEDEKIKVYDKKRTTQNLTEVDIGYAIVKKKVLEMLPDENINFEAYIYPKLVEKELLFATTVEHRYYSIGSWERIELTKKFLSSPKIVFLDRDGTINKRAPKACYIEDPNQFEWLDGAKEAIALLNENKYMVILITNQPGIARGNLTEEILNKIHDKMKFELEEVNAHIDKIYFCPHNWDEGCNCRKPNPGMIFMAQKDLSLDLTKAILIGDDERDIEAANRANIKSYMVDEENSLINIVNKIIN